MSPRLRSAASKLDMYRKVPMDLMEGTKRGSLLSYLALMTIVTLFVLETKAFWEQRTITDLKLDHHPDRKIRLNFNITMMDLKCDWAVIDVVSALGTDQNISTSITKWELDANGVRKTYKGRNRKQDDIQLLDSSVQATLEELHQNGEDAVSLDIKTIEFAKHENEYLFVDFYASWCNHCRDLAPTWETLAEVMVDAGEHLGKQHLEDYSEKEYDAAGKVDLPVMIAKVDCVNHRELCSVQEEIRAYPTLRLFVDGKPWKHGDYRGHRTVLDMVEWLYLVEQDHKQHMDDDEKQLHAAHKAARDRLNNGTEDGLSKEEMQWHDKIVSEKRHLHSKWVDSDHPGCQLSGHLLLDRTPGNFHIQARSQNQEFAAHMTNVSHMVNYISFGDPIVRHWVTSGQGEKIPQDVHGKISPMYGNVYVTENLHESYHHYLKLVSTQIEGSTLGRSDLGFYQMIENSQLAYYRNDMIPEAKFIYDLSPIAVSYRKTSRHWYEYCTSIMAIIGGVFTVVGMLESSIQATVSQVQKRRQIQYRR